MNKELCVMCGNVIYNFINKLNPDKIKCIKAIYDDSAKLYKCKDGTIKAFIKWYNPKVISFFIVENTIF